VKRAYIVIGGMLLLAGAAAGAIFWLHNGSSKVLKLPGIVEIQEVRLGSKIGGRVGAVLVREGDEVYQGQPLVVFEAPELERQLAQQSARAESLRQDWLKAKAGSRKEEIALAQAAVNQALAELVRVEAGWRDEEKRQAASDQEAAEADFKKADFDYNRIAELYRQASASKAELDNASGMRNATRAKYMSAKAHNEMVKAGSRQEDIDVAKQKLEQSKTNFQLVLAGAREEDILAARARYEEAAARLDELKVNLSEKTVVAPDRAIVEVLAVRPGDLVPPNQPILRILRANDLWLKVYVPETEISKVVLGRQVEVRIDAYPDTPFQGKVVQIASIAEFTPRNVQSLDERRQQVFAVKVQVENPRGVFKAGLSAEVILPLEGPP
jgi:HlyD family secretion protein